VEVKKYDPLFSISTIEILVEKLVSISTKLVELEIIMILFWNLLK
jgi:hypothetical protein